LEVLRRRAQGSMRSSDEQSVGITLAPVAAQASSRRTTTESSNANAALLPSFKAEP
jgi:hypothetical protein